MQQAVMCLDSGDTKKSLNEKSTSSEEIQWYVARDIITAITAYYIHIHLHVSYVSITLHICIIQYIQYRYNIDM